MYSSDHSTSEAEPAVRKNCFVRHTIFALLALTPLLIPHEHALAEAAKEKDKAKPADAAAESGVPGLAPGTDYVCEVDIFFKWRPRPKKTNGSTPELDPIKDFFTTAGDEGVVEDEVKNRLGTKIPNLERQAMDMCKSIHQDKTLCVAARMRSSVEHYTKLDFTARRAMAEAIDRDCEHKLGKCLGTEASEIRCHLNRSPEVPMPKEGEAAAPGGEKEKEKKK